MTAAITKVLADAGLAEAQAFDSIDNQKKKSSLLPTHVEYETANRHYAHVDCPGRGLRKEHGYRCNQMDSAILVCAATDGPMPQTREHILLARQVGVPAGCFP